MAVKGSRLNKRVWSLFEAAGFTTKPSIASPAEYDVEISPGKKRTIDLYAEVKSLGIKIIGENKSGKHLNVSITTHINDFAELNKIVKADAIIFVSLEKEFTEDDKKYAAKHRITIWSEKELQYYESLVEALGIFAKYEIIHSLGIETKEEKDTHTVLALRLNQPRSDSQESIYLFTISPERLLKTCAVYRRVQGNSSAYQRMINKKRLPGIGTYLANPEALLPTDIVVNMSDRVSVGEIDIDLNKLSDKKGNSVNISNKHAASLVALHIPMTYASMEVIDGQHRLYGFTHTEDATRNTFNLVVAGISTMPLKKRRDAFIAINDNARRMDPNLVSFLRYSDSTEDECQRDSKLMAIRVVAELNKRSPFENKIRLLDVGRERITLKGFSGYDLKGLISPNGLLRTYYSNSSSEFVQTLSMYFGIIKHYFPKQYSDPDKYIIFTNRGISAFLKLLKSILKTIKAPLTPKTIKQYISALKANKKDRDWEIASLKSSYVGSQGWKDFHRDLVLATS